MTRPTAARGRNRTVARVVVGGLLVVLGVLLIVDPPTGGVPEGGLVGIAIALAGALTAFGRRYDIAARIMWAITGATFAITLVHYNVACTALYSGANLAIPPGAVWQACAPAWPLFETPMLVGSLLLLLLAVRDAFDDGFRDERALVRPPAVGSTEVTAD